MDVFKHICEVLQVLYKNYLLCIKLNCFMYLATGSDPSGVVGAVFSSGTPGGVGRRARRLGRI